MHAATLGRELGVKRIVVPRHAGLFSAWGMLAARPRIDLHRTRLARLRPETFAHVDEAFAELRAEAAAIFSASPESSDLRLLNRDALLGPGARHRHAPRSGRRV